VMRVKNRKIARQKGFVPISEKKNFVDSEEKFNNFLYNYSQEFGIKDKQNYNKFNKREKYIMGVPKDHREEVLREVYHKNPSQDVKYYLSSVKEFLEKKGYYHVPTQRDMEDAFIKETLNAQSIERTKDKYSRE